MNDILNGRRRAPTDDEFAAHAAVGGYWRAVRIDQPEGLPLATRDAMSEGVARGLRDNDAELGIERLWWATNGIGQIVPIPVPRATLAGWERHRIVREWGERGASQYGEDTRTAEGAWGAPLTTEARAALCAHLGLDEGGVEAEILGSPAAVEAASEAACDGYEAAAVAAGCVR